jgi:hypothetical protein
MDIMPFKNTKAAWFSQFLGILNGPELVFAASMLSVHQYVFPEELCHWLLSIHLEHCRRVIHLHIRKLVVFLE